MQLETVSPSPIIKEWLNHFKINHHTEVPFSDSSAKLQFYIPSIALGILVPNWKKPISVTVLHQAVHAYENMNLSEVVIIADRVSFYVEETMKRLRYPVKIIDSYSLSELLVLFERKSKSIIA